MEEGKYEDEGSVPVAEERTEPVPEERAEDGASALQLKDTKLLNSQGRGGRGKTMRTSSHGAIIVIVLHLITDLHAVTTISNVVILKKRMR